MNCIYGKLAAIQISVIQPLWFLCRPVYSISYEMKIELGGKMLYLFKYSSIWLFNLKWKRDWKSPKYLAKTEPEDTHTEKQVKKQNIKFAKRHKNSWAWYLEGQGYTRFSTVIKCSNHRRRRRVDDGVLAQTRHRAGKEQEDNRDTGRSVSSKRWIFSEGTNFFSARILKNPYICLELLKFIWQKWLNVQSTLWVGISSSATY